MKLTTKGRYAVMALTDLALYNNKGPVYNYELDESKFEEKWSVNRRILGKKGSRWLPVRESSYYATEALKQLLVDRGVEITNISRKKVPKTSRLLCTHYSVDNKIILKSALKYSKNMVTESLGLITSRLVSENLYDLDQSAIL